MGYSGLGLSVGSSEPRQPWLHAAPDQTSADPAPSTPARSTAALTEKAPSVGARVLLNEPRAALVSGVRAVETMTASRMIGVLLSGSGYLNGGGRPDRKSVV